MAKASYPSEIARLAVSWRRSLRAGNRSEKTMKAYMAAAEQLADHLSSERRSSEMAIDAFVARPSPAMLASILKCASSLLATAADPRRVRLEPEQPKGDDVAADVAWLDEARRRLKSHNGGRRTVNCPGLRIPWRLTLRRSAAADTVTCRGRCAHRAAAG